MFINFRALPSLGYWQHLQFALFFRSQSPPFFFVWILSFEVLVYSWSRKNFKFSYEWCIVKLQGISTKLPSNRLNVDFILNNAQWANYKPEEPDALILTPQKEPLPL
ncbi:MAG: hypothetical protein ACTSP5_16135 [Candidatus Heimdallarchaeota archaeon]